MINGAPLLISLGAFFVSPRVQQSMAEHLQLPKPARSSLGILCSTMLCCARPLFGRRSTGCLGTLRLPSLSDTIDGDMGIIQSVLPALPFIQIILSILLIGVILLQQRGSSLGGAFGGDNFQAAFNKRRGAEEFLFRLAIGLAILFAISAFLNILA